MQPLIINILTELFHFSGAQAEDLGPNGNFFHFTCPNGTIFEKGSSVSQPECRGQQIAKNQIAHHPQNDDGAKEKEP